MTSPFSYSIDDKDLDDAALWAVIDSAAASLSSSTKSRKPLALKYNNVTLQSPSPISTASPSPQAKLPNKNPRNHYRCNSSSDGEVLQENSRPHKLARISCVSELSETSYGLIPTSSASPSPPLAIVKHVQRTPTAMPISYSSPVNHEEPEERVSMMHSLFGRFPSVSLFKEYQNAAMEILEKGDYTMIFGCPYIKKSGWRKISFYFNLSYEIKDKTIEFDENRNAQRAEFVVRAHMQGGRFSDGWGSCERREKKFLKPNHDIPSTAETRAKNKACQDLLGIGEYRPGASHGPQQQ